MPQSFDVERETDRQTGAWTSYVNEAPPSAPVTMPLSTAGQPPASRELEWKVGVRAPLLERWLGERWVSRCIRVDSADLNMNQVQQIVDSLLPDVPLERRRKSSDPVSRELLVVDRDAFALELAREWVRSGLPRSQVR